MEQLLTVRVIGPGEMGQADPGTVLTAGSPDTDHGAEDMVAIVIPMEDFAGFEVKKNSGS